MILKSLKRADKKRTRCPLRVCKMAVTWLGGHKFFSDWFGAGGGTVLLIALIGRSTYLARLSIALSIGQVQAMMTLTYGGRRKAPVGGCKRALF